jgi:hypothetical protein
MVQGHAATLPGRSRWQTGVALPFMGVVVAPLAQRGRFWFPLPSEGEDQGEGDSDQYAACR